ncbi:DUF6531 domain-containing protein, partial [Pseudomonas sp. PIC25]|uniref:DUF6531 domain-containing protein n=1 Tax=Pseudomonas sp. PIC25 TaxID=1958773 RepID=UPI00117A908F
MSLRLRRPLLPKIRKNNTDSKLKKPKLLAVALFAFGCSSGSKAEILPIERWSELCSFIPSWTGTALYKQNKYFYHVILSKVWQDSGYTPITSCRVYHTPYTATDYYANISLVDANCPTQEFFNSKTGKCESDGINNDGSKGPPNIPGDNAPPPCTGNPINSAIGNKYQLETDYSQQAQGIQGLSFTRVYNSQDGKWRHSYSTQLGITSSLLVLIHADGRQALFARSGSVTTPQTPEKGTLKLESSGWVYTSPANEKLLFNSSGRLTRRQWPSGYFQTLTYSGTYSRTITITDSLGQALTVTEDALHQPLALTTDGVSIAYGYSADGRQLQTVTKTQNGQTLVRRYHYEDPRNPKLLTGITDERGIRYATWTYDDQGRAISSEHANGA